MSTKETFFWTKSLIFFLDQNNNRRSSFWNYLKFLENTQDPIARSILNRGKIGLENEKGEKERWKKFLFLGKRREKVIDKG